MKNFKEKLSNIKAFVFDVDGVFSGHILITSTGEQLHPMNMKDGYAVQLAIKKGYPIAIITGGSSEVLRIRFTNLGVKDIYISTSNKVIVFEEFCRKYNLSYENVLYMGDDIPDYPAMKMAGIATCPSDAVIDIKEISNYISDFKGGEGCVRDVIEQVLRVQEKWMTDDSYIW